MKPLLASLAACGVTLATAALFLTSAHVDTVSSASFFYTNQARTGWVYPNDNSYTSVFFVDLTNSIPLVYAGENQDAACLWAQTPSLGGAFLPLDASISKYRWIPTNVGEFTSVFMCQNDGDATLGYSQTFFFAVVPEPGLGLALIAGATMLVARRRMRK